MKTIKAVLCLLLAFIMLLLTACSGGSAAYKLKSADLEISTEKSVSKAICTEKKGKDDLLKISRSDMAVLYFDKDNYSVCVYDTNGKHLWKSLPDKYISGAPAVLSADVYFGTKKVTFNSQNDSVKKGLASYEIDKNSIVVTYKFEFNTQDSEKNSLSVPVKYEMADSTLSVSIDCAKLRLEKPCRDFVVNSIRLLDFFGSSSSGQKGDYIFVPEGSGALIDTEEKADKFRKITVPVYGADIAGGETSDYSARVAAFGMKQADNAFVALIENGDAIAKIFATKALKKSEYNRVGAAFDITKVKKNDEKVYASKEPYAGEIKISYRFLSGENANYCAMASACREILIRNGTLSLQESELTAEYPFVLSLIGAASLGKEKPKVQTLTTFEEAEEIISFFRSKGISDIALRYRGMFGGQLLQSSAEDLKVNSKLGSKEALESFLQFTNMQNIKVYPEVNLISAKKGKISNSVSAIDASPLLKTETKISNGSVYSGGKVCFAELSKLGKYTDSLIANFRNSSFNGVCLADLGNVLYTDFSSKPFNRQQAMEMLSDVSSSIAPNKSIMTDGGNIYSVKYSDLIVNLPNSSKLAKLDYCSSAAFLQVLLHGVIPYCSKPVNLCSNSDTAVLRAAQYGEILSYEFYYTNPGTDDSKDNLYYMNFGNHAQSSFERLSTMFADLSSRKITNMYCVKKGVYCTEYGDDISVYVNYNSKDVRVNGVTVEAKSFLKV